MKATLQVTDLQQCHGGIRLAQPPCLPALEPDVRRVEVLEGRDVDRVLHLGWPGSWRCSGLVIGKNGASSMTCWSAWAHRALASSSVLADARLLDQGVGRRAVVEPEVAADRREGRPCRRTAG